MRGRTVRRRHGCTIAPGRRNAPWGRRTVRWWRNGWRTWRRAHQVVEEWVVEAMGEEDTGNEPRFGSPGPTDTSMT